MLYETLGDLQPGEEKGAEGMLIIRVSGSVVGENRWAEVGNSLILQYLTRGGKGANHSIWKGHIYRESKGCKAAGFEVIPIVSFVAQEGFYILS